MKLFLCGGGHGDNITEAMSVFNSLIDKTKPLLYVPLAMESERYPSCYEWITGEMALIDLSNIEMVTNANQIVEKDLNDYCAIFIGGGNTFKLLKELKESGAFEKIQEYIQNDGIVFGGSAGAIIFGADIKSCTTQDPNDVGLVDTYGFNVLNNNCLLCHLNRDDGVEFDKTKNSKFLEVFSKEKKTFYIPDNDVIFINDNQISIIGKSDYEVYDNGEIIIGKVDNFEDFL